MTATPTASPIDMLDPWQVCGRLGVTEAELVNLVNSGSLAAYRLGGALRFRQLDVLAAS